MIVGKMGIDRSGESRFRKYKHDGSRKLLKPRYLACRQLFRIPD